MKGSGLWSFCLLSLVLFNAAMASAQGVYFANANLKWAVERELGITDPTADDMLALTYLDANNEGISDLAGLEYGVNLTSLSLRDNRQISDISLLSGLTKLTTLGCSAKTDTSDSSSPTRPKCH